MYNGVLYLEVPKKDTLFIYEKIWTPQLQLALDNIKDKTGKDLKVSVVAKDAENYNKVLTLGKDYDSNGQMRINQVTSFPRPQLEDENIFENFVEGKSNQYALGVSQAVAQNISNKSQARLYLSLIHISEPTRQVR